VATVQVIVRIENVDSSIAIAALVAPSNLRAVALAVGSAAGKTAGVSLDPSSLQVGLSPSPSPSVASPVPIIAGAVAGAVVLAACGYFFRIRGRADNRKRDTPTHIPVTEDTTFSAFNPSASAPRTAAAQMETPAALASQVDQRSSFAPERVDDSAQEIHHDDSSSGSAPAAQI